MHGLFGFKIPESIETRERMEGENEEGRNWMDGMEEGRKKRRKERRKEQKEGKKGRVEGTKV